MDETGSKSYITSNGIHQFGIFSGSEDIATPKKIQMLVFEEDLFNNEKYKHLISPIIKTANQKNIPVCILCPSSNNNSQIKPFIEAYQLKVTVTGYFAFNELFEKDTSLEQEKYLFATLPNSNFYKSDTSFKQDQFVIQSEENFTELSVKIQNQLKNIISPESEFLADLMATRYKLPKAPSIVLKNENLLLIIFDQPDTELNNKLLKKYNPELDGNAKIVEIKSRAQIERFVNDHGGDVAKLYDDAELSYTPMPEVIQGIIFEHDTLIQYHDGQLIPNPYQSEMINLIKQAIKKGIPVIVRYTKSESEGQLSDLLYRPEHRLNYQNLPTLNQSDLNAEFRKKEGLARDDYLYITIPNGTLYQTDTGFRTHVLLITSQNHLNYLSEKIEFHDASMLRLEKLRVAKYVRNTCTLSKMPSINLINENLLHIIIISKQKSNEDIQNILIQYKETYGAELNRDRKVIKIKSQDQIEKFIEDHNGDVKEFYKQAGCTFKGVFECSQQ